MSRSSRVVTGLVCSLLAVVAIGVLDRIHDFAETRFLTIDEFQWGHATWLMSQGQIPYRDFYEHHLPLGYGLHAKLLDNGAPFVDRVMQLREIGFGYLLVALAAVALATWKTNRSLPETLLTLCIVPSVGFGLMSAIDYRGDNWAAFSLITALSLIEINRKHASRGLAALAGGLVVVAIAMTQKIVLLGASAVGLMWLVTTLARSERARKRIGALRIDHPVPFALAGGILALIGFAWLFVHGIAGDAFEINVLHAIEHERLYPRFGIGQYLAPFLAETGASSAALALFAGVHVLGGIRNFWVLPLLAALVGTLLIRAPFPYNYVLVCWLLAICAVRGYSSLVRFLLRRGDAAHPAQALGSLAYLLPLLILPAQLGFVAGTSSNVDQLTLLERIERHSGPDEVVIDSAGGALFRPHRGYHWYQGRAHIKMFDDYFQHGLVPDMRASEALFWIRSVRFDLLPEAAQRYLMTHYVPLFGDLHVLGFATRATGPDERRTGRIDVLRSGPYHVVRVDADVGDGTIAPFVRIDGVEISGSTIELAKGIHEMEIGPGTPAYRFSYLPPEAFGPPTQARSHTPLFEFRRSERPGGSDPS
jgi:hypothetical protein